MTEIFNKEQPASDLLTQIWHMVGKSNFQVRSIFCRMLRWVEVVGKVGWHANDNKGERGHIIDSQWLSYVCRKCYLQLLSKERHGLGLAVYKHSLSLTKTENDCQTFRMKYGPDTKYHLSMFSKDAAWPTNLLLHCVHSRMLILVLTNINWCKTW